MEWSKDWPTIPGLYWMYGWAFGSEIRDKRPASFYFVSVKKISNGFCYVTNGHFLFKGEGAKGFWQPVTLPNVPDEASMQELMNS